MLRLFNLNWFWKGERIWSVEPLVLATQPHTHTPPLPCSNRYSTKTCNAEHWFLPRMVFHFKGKFLESPYRYRPNAHAPTHKQTISVILASAETFHTVPGCWTQTVLIYPSVKGSHNFFFTKWSPFSFVKFSARVYNWRTLERGKKKKTTKIIKNSFTCHICTRCSPSATLPTPTPPQASFLPRPPFLRFTPFFSDLLSPARHAKSFSVSFPKPKQILFRRFT